MDRTEQDVQVPDRKVDVFMNVVVALLRMHFLLTDWLGMCCWPLDSSPTVAPSTKSSEVSS